MRRLFGDLVASAAALGALLLALVSVDDRVREEVSLRFSSGEATAAVMSAGTHVRDLSGILFDVARDQSVEHAPLMIFVLTATMLLVFFFRT